MIGSIFWPTLNPQPLVKNLIISLQSVRASISIIYIFIQPKTSRTRAQRSNHPSDGLACEANQLNDPTRPIIRLLLFSGTLFSILRIQFNLQACATKYSNSIFFPQVGLHSFFFFHKKKGVLNQSNT